ncbi:TPA: phage antirepressor KilAC domain-containing protein, partial [Listeria monocytogenes]
RAITDPDFLIRLATNLKEEKSRRLEAEQKLEVQRPKVLFADAVSDTEGTILIRDLAKLIQQNGVDIGEKRLFEWLRQNGYLISRRGTDYNRPTQKSMELG